MSGVLVKHEPSGLWWPSEVTRADAEYHYMSKRVTDVDVAVRYCKKRHMAVQAGGNVGMWPLRIAKFFDIVHTFEPVPYYVEALKRNVAEQPKIIVHGELLSERTGDIVPFSTKPDGRSRVVDRSSSECNDEKVTSTIDALDLPGCDALFLDVEGHEAHALRGALRTITRFRPVITVEVWEKNEKAYAEFFAALDYRPTLDRVHADRIYVPR